MSTEFEKFHSPSELELTNQVIEQLELPNISNALRKSAISLIDKEFPPEPENRVHELRNFLLGQLSVLSTQEEVLRELLAKEMELTVKEVKGLSKWSEIAFAAGISTQEAKERWSPVTEQKHSTKHTKKRK